MGWMNCWWYFVIQTPKLCLYRTCIILWTSRDCMLVCRIRCLPTVLVYFTFHALHVLYIVLLDNALYSDQNSNRAGMQQFSSMCFCSILLFSWVQFMFLALFLQIELTPAQLMKILKGAGLTKLLVLVSPDVTPDLHNTMQYTTDHRVHWLNRLVVECTCISI